MDYMGQNMVYRETMVFDNKYDRWVKIDFRDLKKGNRFKLFEGDDEPVLDLGGNAEWVANTDAYPEPDSGIYLVEVETNKQ